jgi:hypothetical protein
MDKVIGFYEWQNKVLSRLFYSKERTVKLGFKTYSVLWTHGDWYVLYSGKFKTIEYSATMKYYRLIKRIEKKLDRLEKKKELEDRRKQKEADRVEALFKKERIK